MTIRCYCKSRVKKRTHRFPTGLYSPPQGLRCRCGLASVSSLQKATTKKTTKKQVGEFRQIKYRGGREPSVHIMHLCVSSLTYNLPPNCITVRGVQLT